jgi:hypothetical protein
MAITDCTLVQATTTSTGFVRNYTEIYQVITDAATTDLKSVVEYNGALGGLPIPEYGQPFEHDNISVVLSKSAQQADGTRTKFVVTVEYGPYDRAGHNLSADEFNNPLEAPPEYTWGFASRSRALTEDANGQVIVNAAGDPFIPAPEKQEFDLQLTVVQNLEDFSPLQAWSFMGKVNSREFPVAGFIVPVKGALLTERSATSEIFVKEDEDNFRIEYWEVTTVLQLRRDDERWLDENDQPLADNHWFKRILNAGLNQRVPDLANPGQFRKVPIELDGQAISDPLLLDRDGAYEDDKANAVWLEFEIYDTADLGQLAL